MIDWRPILFIIGGLLATIGLAMMIPALYELAIGGHDWVTFFISGLITLFIGIALTFTNQAKNHQMTIKEAFLMTSLTWIILTLFAAIPFTISSQPLSFSDAYFESMSGLTTTGATIITELQGQSRGILLWRAILQWLGGLGIIVMALAVMPMLQIGGMQLFRIESFDTSEKILPRATQLSGSLFMLYSGLTAICALSYYLADMSTFDALCHAMTTIATGGFSNYDTSMSHFNNHNVELIAIFFMIIGSLPFIRYLQLISGRPDKLTNDTQVRWLFITLTVMSLLALLAQNLDHHHYTFAEARHALFAITSVMTGTGYATENYDAWSYFSQTLFFLAMLIGGCAGSTSCGVKIFRYQILFEILKTRVISTIYPSAVYVPRYNGKPLTFKVSSAVMNFFLLFFSSFLILGSALSFFGLDGITAFSSAATALANVGPGLGDIVGPSGNFSTLPDGAKWLMSAGMLLGRLEFFTVLVLFLPIFWRS